MCVYGQYIITTSISINMTVILVIHHVDPKCS